MSFTRYPAYKDSGVEWLGEVPDHWAIIQSRRMFRARRKQPEKRTSCLQHRKNME